MRMLMLMVVISGLTAGAVFAGQNSHAVMADNEGGPILVTGQWNYKNFIIPTQYLEPVVILMDVSRPIQGNYTDFVPRTGQIIGQLTSSFSSPPVDYQVMVPRKPTGQYVDLDNNGHKNTGIQIFAITVGSNMVGDSYLEQLEQLSFSSFLADPHTAMIREGTFLIYAPDDQQGFPTSAGKDGQIFTTDDPTVSVSAGYTLVTLSADGSISFDRSKEAQMDTIEVVTFKSPDFSNQSILKSYNSLIDLLKQRYAYTELRQLDWEKIRQKYLPQVHKADAKDDMAGYYLELSKLAQSIHDSHVQVSATDAGIKMAPYLKILAQTETNLGAQVVKLSDERFIVTFLDPKGPAKKAGWEFGTEILSVDGISMKKRMETLLYTSSESTSEGLLNARLPHALSFPAEKPVTIKFRLSGENEIRSATLTAGKQFQTKSVYYEEREEISFKKLEHDYGYIQWDAFHDPLYELAVWEKFLSTFNYSSGIIIDLRGNIGGNVALLDTMASFLFTADNPAPFHWIDLYVFDEQVNDFVQSFASDYKLSAPKPELAYTGGVVVLVDGKSASAAEYFPQFLQQQGRAIVVGEHGTEGAGGYIDRVKLPGTMTFQFTKGRSVFAGTDEFLPVDYLFVETMFEFVAEILLLKLKWFFQE